MQVQRNNDPSQLYPSGSYNSHDQQARSRHELLSKISLEPEVLKALHIAGSWWLPWRTIWPPLTESDEKLSLVDFVHYNLAHENVINVASGLICIAICLQQMRPGADDHDVPFSAPPHELANNLLTVVDQLALANEDNLASLDGLEALVLRAKSYVNANNQPRKSWLMIRRAISMAQLMDLPRADPGQETAETLRRQRFMGALFERDRFMSLLMGLPYAVDDNFNEKVAKQALHSPADINTQMRALRRMVALVAGKVNDRNSSTLEANESTLSLVQETLDDAASTLPCDWWNVETHSDVSNDLQSSHEHLSTQLWFYQVQSFLHLPLMLRPASDTRFEQSRQICLSSSRNLLRVYHALRQPHLAPYSSKCVDFQALIAVVLVLLGLLQQGSQDWHHVDAGCKEDIDLINTTRQVFETCSMEQGGSVARQGVHMIDSLGAFVAGGERNDFIRTATLFVPYFGTISVQSGRDGSAAKAASERTNSIAYSDSSSSSHSSSQQPQPHHPRPTNVSASDSGPTTCPVAPQIIGSADGQSGLPGQFIQDTVPITTRMPAPVDQCMALSGTTACRFDLPPPPLPIPLPGPTIPYLPRTDVLSNSAIDGEPSYVDVDFDWQRLMVGAELDQDWNVGVDLGAAQVF